MPDIFFRCPDCDGHLVVDSRGVGLSLPCPFCESQVTIPQQSQNNKGDLNAAGVKVSKQQRAALAGVAQPQPAQRGTVSKPPPTKKGNAASSTNGTVPSVQPSKARHSNLDDDLNWTDDPNHDLGKINEIKRLASMMKEDENYLSAEGTSKRGPISFRCPSCGQVMSAKRSRVGAQTQCGSCSAEFRVPPLKETNPDVRPTKSTKGKIPARRNVTLRTADDLRRSESAAPNSSDAELSNLDGQFQELIKRELEKLQGETAPEPTSAPKEPIKRKPPPPLAQHSEVVPVDANGNPSATRLTRTTPLRDPNAPLPEMIAMDSMDLDSEVARQWGESAVVRTARLNWMASLVILILVGVGGYFAYEQIHSPFEHQPAKEPETTSSSSESVAVKSTNGVDSTIDQEIMTALQAFHDAVVPEEKAVHVRNSASVLPLMREYYRANDVESRLLNKRSVRIQPVRYDGRQFYSVDGEYENLRSFHADFEKGSDDRFVLDWKGWVGMGEMPIGTFTENGVETAHTFRVWVEVQDYYNLSYTNSGKYRSYALKDRDDTVRLFGYAENGTETGDALFQLFKELKKDNKRQRARLMLKLRFAPDTDKRRGQVVIDELVNDSWVDLTQ